jgi:hypothetical protein
MRLTTSRGTQLTQSCSALRARRIEGSCSGMRDVCPVRFLRPRNCDATCFFTLMARKPARPTTHAQGLPSPDQLRTGRRITALCIIREPTFLHVLRERSRRLCDPSTVVAHGSCPCTFPFSFTLHPESDPFLNNWCFGS